MKELLKELPYSWFGAGWASFKEGTVAENHNPIDEEALSGWLNGFFMAFAYDLDDKAMQGILQGDYTQGERAEDALLRIAPAIYVIVSDNAKLKKEYGLNI